MASAAGAPSSDLVLSTVLDHGDGSLSASLHHRDRLLVAARATPGVGFGREREAAGAQYAHAMHARLGKAKARMEEAAVAKWGAEKALECLAVSAEAAQVQLRHLQAGGDQPDAKQAEAPKAVVVALLSKEMRLRPSALDDALGGKAGASKLLGTGKKFVDAEDALYLEDDTGRLKVSADSDKLKPANHTNGVVVACLVRARPAAPDVVDVDDVMYLGDVAPDRAPAAAPMATDSPEAAPAFVLLVSGLSVGTADPARLGLLVDFVAGAVGDADTAARIAHVVIAGNSVAKASDEGSSADTDVANLAALDALLARLAALVPCDVMPGPDDPAAYALPQPPMHTCMLPAATASPGLSLRGNPLSIDVTPDVGSAVTFLGHAGQPVDDAWRYLDEESRLEVLASTLRWRHLAPTAPDTLVAVPDGGTDALAMEATPPAVLFAGNQPEFATRMEGATRLVCVPSYAATGAAVLVNIHTLEAHELRLS